MKRAMNGSTHWKIHARARFAAILSMRIGCLMLTATRSWRLCGSRWDGEPRGSATDSKDIQQEDFMRNDFQASQAPGSDHMRSETGARP